MNPSPEMSDWLVKSWEDEQMAYRSMMPSAFPASAAFHAQQAAEKALKAYLVASMTPIERIHNLLYLRNQLESIAPWLARQISEESCITLTQFAVAVRYPGVLTPEPVQALKAISAASTICRLVRQSLHAICP